MEVAKKAIGRIGRFNVSGKFYLYAIGKTMIDTGPPNQWARVKPFVEKHGIERVLITHHHEDHAGNAGKLIEMGLRVQMPADTIALLQKPLPQEVYRLFIWGRAQYPCKVSTESNLLGETTHLDDTNLDVKLVHAPGHCADHHVLFVPQEGMLFGSDIFVSKRRKNYRFDETPTLELESLKKVLKLDFSTLYCSHRGVIKGGRSLLQERVDFLEETIEKVRGLASSGLSEREITRRVLGREDVVYLISTGDHSKINLVKSILGTLGQ